ncbi:hypothetical protein COLO4_01531 [Corchorus olitorius]|uniref:Uncharacterized protein n=1 Tax=Corchorus olitorius TaxID=93759 RepID=A0A1R3L2I0_9ROSI|nr:hypothetical protein COLO4_01531 [Corchorus olitorius]
MDTALRPVLGRAQRQRPGRRARFRYRTARRADARCGFPHHRRHRFPRASTDRAARGAQAGAARRHGRPGPVRHPHPWRRSDGAQGVARRAVQPVSARLFAALAQRVVAHTRRRRARRVGRAQAAQSFSRRVAAVRHARHVGAQGIALPCLHAHRGTRDGHPDAGAAQGDGPGAVAACAAQPPRRQARRQRHGAGPIHGVSAAAPDRSDEDGACHARRAGARLRPRARHVRACANRRRQPHLDPVRRPEDVQRAGGQQPHSRDRYVNAWAAALRSVPLPRGRRARHHAHGRGRHAARRPRAGGGRPVTPSSAHYFWQTARRIASPSERGTTASQRGPSMVLVSTVPCWLSWISALTGRMRPALQS